MKIVVIGGTGLIGSKLITKLKALRHEALAAAPNTVVNTLTGEGLAAELSETSLVPIGDAQLGETRFSDWLNLSTATAAATKTV